MLIPQVSFHEETSGGVKKCWLFSESLHLTSTCVKTLIASQIFLLVKISVKTNITNFDTM